MIFVSFFVCVFVWMPVMLLNPLFVSPLNKGKSDEFNEIVVRQTEMEMERSI